MGEGSLVFLDIAVGGGHYTQAHAVGTVTPYRHSRWVIVEVGGTTSLEQLLDLQQ